MKARVTESAHRPALSPEELKAIDRDAEKFLTRFACAHAAAIARNLKAVRRRLIRLITTRFKLKRGPKPDSLIVEAEQMLRQGVKRREVYRRLLPGFDALDKYGRTLLGRGFGKKLDYYRRSLREDRKKLFKNPRREKHHNSENKNPSETRG